MRRIACPPSPVKRQARLEPCTVRSQPRRGRRPQIGAEQPTIEILRHQLQREAHNSRNELKRSQFESGATFPFGREVLALVRVVVRDESLSSGISMAEARNEATSGGTFAFTMASAKPVRLQGEPNARGVSNLQPST
jgi:hypothetical protein